ncbi:Interferon-induced protein with tetratricopeptide repeats 5 [Holothuria leucospilota]|uniref:Interferon-induced protein with tetratricopeptide repeats 5 n=1 Tax=Holothuria leucospilota TaxID=206669 RepID=A0A9Q1HAA3_HOLLE|nr:Interferon-induced protein with tetratricopeptide repeats 5 [Holothuria leucospilota]
MAEHTIDWWKAVPCHFTWDLEAGVDVDFKSILNNLDSKLETCHETRWEGSPCALLLFRGYLEVSKFDGVIPNREKAEEFFKEADNENENVTNSEERKTYTIVSLANRLWILEHFGDEADDETSANRETLIRKLEEVWESPKEVSDKVSAHLEATAAFAMSRLGPGKYEKAEALYRKAIAVISTQSSWWHSLGLLIRRQAVLKTQNREKCYDRMEEEIHCYEKAIKFDPDNDSARCDLALLLAKIPGREEEAKSHIGRTKDDICEVIIKKGRYYRRQKKFQEALHVLQKGEDLKNPRSELFFQISCIYFDLGLQAGKNKDFTRKSEYVSSEVEYLDKCLQLEPTHFFAKINKAKSFGKLGQVSTGEELFCKIIEEQKEHPRNLINAKFSFAKYLHYHNKNSMSAEVARILEDVIELSLRVLREIDHYENNKITGENGYLEKSRKKLVEFYRTQKDGEDKLKDLENKLSNLICKNYAS